MSDRLVLALGLMLVVLFSGYLFQRNLPLWCATPLVGSNMVVQPLCPLYP